MCCATIGRIILIILNLVFLLVSIALLAVGVILKFFPSTLFDYLVEIIKEIGNRVPFHYPQNINVLPVIDSLGVALIVFGCILFVVSFLACCGACCEWRPLLILYVILVLILVLIQAVVGGLFLDKESVLNTNLKNDLSSKVKDEYTNASADDPFTGMVNLISYSMQCCGFNGTDDFAQLGGKPPPSCCKKDVMVADPNRCLASAPGDFNDVGCYDKLYGYIEANKPWIITIFVLILLLQLVEVIFAIVVVKDVSK